MSPNWWVNKWYRIHLNTIFSYRDLHYNYRITDTCRTREILLLLFLVLTCHLNMPTFLIRFYVTYYCGWLCRGSTIYRSYGKDRQPNIRPCENYDLHMKWEPTQTESQQKQQAPLKAIPWLGSLDINTKNPGNTMSTQVCCKTYDWTSYSIP